MNCLGQIMRYFYYNVQVEHPATTYPPQVINLTHWHAICQERMVICKRVDHSIPHSRPRNIYFLPTDYVAMSTAWFRFMH